MELQSTQTINGKADFLPVLNEKCINLIYFNKNSIISSDYMTNQTQDILNKLILKQFWER